MRSRAPITLFPFLSVLISTMGVLAFLAVTFLLLARQENLPAQAKRSVEVSWVGAPPHVKPMLVECLEDGVRIHPGRGGKPRFFSRRLLENEVKAVKILEKRAIQRLGPAYNRYQFWLFMKNSIPNEQVLRNSFTLSMHRMELYNLSGEGRRNFEQRYPIFLVYPDGVAIHEMASYLVDVSTRMNKGLEPMLPGWKLPYQDKTS